MKARKTAIATTLVAAVFLAIAQAPAANASWELLGSYFRASDYNPATQTKEGTLTASGYACKISVPKQGYKIKGYVKVTQSSISSPSSKPVWAFIQSGSSYATGPAVAASVGKTSTTPLANGYVSASASVRLYLQSDELLTGSPATVTVSNLNAC
jgi:hypothetical protein